MYADLLTKIQTKNILVGVVGVGYVGESIYERLMEQGIEVIGVDVDIRKTLRSDRRISSDFSVLKDCDVVVIAVPTPLDKDYNPNLNILIEAAKSVAPNLKKGVLVCSESTSYPGTTREVLLPILKSKELKIDETLFLVNSPERVDPGSSWKVHKIPKLIGGVSTSSLELGLAFYSLIIDQLIPTSSAEISEFAKVLENTYRMVNIGLVNEMAVAAHTMGLNFWEVIDVASTKPFGFTRFEPGPGVGGDCLMPDSIYLSQKIKEVGASADVLLNAWETNHRMPKYLVDRISEVLKDCKKEYPKVHFLGVSYKKNSQDPRNSPFEDTLKELGKFKISVSYHDPYIPEYSYLKSEKLTVRYLSEKDLVVIFTDHDCFDYKWIVENSKKVLDARGRTWKEGIHGVNLL